MTNYEMYTFLICLVMFLLLAGTFTLFLVNFYKSSKKLINLGGEDNNILKDAEKKQKETKKQKTFKKVLDAIVSGLIVTASVGVFVFSLVVTPKNITDPVTTQTAQVVKSSSMSYRNTNNQYLFDNNLTNQFDTFDLVMVNKLPAEQDLKLWDIVVYESNGKLVIHRIVEIEEPNEYHPTLRYFRTQGDAIDTHDKFPVLYEQMRGIYTGQKIPFVGSFILFLQSYAGILCICLVVASTIVTPILENGLDKEKEKRYALIDPQNISEQVENPNDVEKDELISRLTQALEKSNEECGSHKKQVEALKEKVKALESMPQQQRVKTVVKQHILKQTTRHVQTSKPTDEKEIKVKITK